MFDFKDKVLVLTGANGGIGQSVAKIFFELGANIVLSDMAVESATLGKLQKNGGADKFCLALDPSGERAVFVPSDVTHSKDCDALARLAKERFGHVDFLVLGAGIYQDQMTADMTDEQWRQTLDVNLNGAFYCCRAMIPFLRVGGSIVHLASVAAHRGSYQHAHYAASKGALLSFSRSLALELAPGIRVNAVSPGLIETKMIKHRLEKEGNVLIEPTALKRLGQPQEVAKVIAFLCSDWASFITGETVHVNGGIYIAG